MKVTCEENADRVALKVRDGDIGQPVSIEITDGNALWLHAHRDLAPEKAAPLPGPAAR